jgi:undecaprenyl diphosphate synthase
MDSTQDNFQAANIPQHIAIIMDGNGRWAKKQGKIRTAGHEAGTKSVRKIVEESVRLNIKYLTLYTFSTENWNRPKYEINALMQILVNSLNKEEPTLNKNNIRLHAIGHLDQLKKDIKKQLMQVIDNTSKNDGLNLVLALSYSAKWEIIEAVKTITEEVKQNKLESKDITKDLFKNYLCTKNFPDPDLLIRTGGEQRISNFLLWQIAYSELYFTPCLWPDFDEKALKKAIIDYQNRERRFGKTSEQLIHNENI